MKFLMAIMVFSVLIESECLAMDRAPMDPDQNSFRWLGDVHPGMPLIGSLANQDPEVGRQRFPCLMNIWHQEEKQRLLARISEDCSKRKTLFQRLRTNHQIRGNQSWSSPKNLRYSSIFPLLKRH